LLSVGIMLCSCKYNAVDKKCRTKLKTTDTIESSTDELDFELASPSDALKIIRIQRACTVGEQYYGLPRSDVAVAK